MTLSPQRRTILAPGGRLSRVLTLHVHERQDRAARGHWRPGSPSRARYRRALAPSRGAAEQTEEHVMNETQPVGIFNLHGVRYQVTDAARTAAFYTDHLGFRLEHQPLPAFASVLLGDFRLLLSGPGASGSRPMPDERTTASASLSGSANSRRFHFRPKTGSPNRGALLRRP